MEKLHKFLNIILPILLGFASAYLVSSYIYCQDTDVSVKLPEPKTINNGKNDSSRNNLLREKIIASNIFDLEINNAKPIVVNKAKPFKGELIGIVEGTDKSFIIVRDGKTITMLNKGNNSWEGSSQVEVLDIFPKSAIIRYDKNTITLKLVENQSELKGLSKSDSRDDSMTIKRTVKRKDVKDNLKDANSLISTMYISPYYTGGKFVGYRLSRMRIDAFLRQTGIENGDVLVRMNGEDIKSPDKMFDMFLKWKNATAVTIDLVRKGRKQTIFVEIE